MRGVRASAAMATIAQERYARVLNYHLRSLHFGMLLAVLPS